MNEENAFIRAAAKNSEDNVLHLVYADWLEENGQPERAEFIRVQVEQARLPPRESHRERLNERLRQTPGIDPDKWRAELPQLPADAGEHRPALVEQVLGIGKPLSELDLVGHEERLG